LPVLCLLGPGNLPALANCHTWDVSEIFSNADGTIQFIELREPNGGCCEDGVPGHRILSSKRSFTIPLPDLAQPTAFRRLLFGTASYAQLPGAPTPDYIIPSNFFDLDGDSVGYTPYDTMVFGPGELPTDGINSLTPRALGNLVGINSPENYAGETGDVNAGTAVSPPPVPDGTGPGLPMTVLSQDPAGTSLSLWWDVAFCDANDDHVLVYGQGSQLPAGPGGTFAVEGSVCGIGGSVPFVWNDVPSASDGTGLLWWILVVPDGAGGEGSWGQDSSSHERRGPGPGGSSAQCGNSSKELSNACPYS
jgi:hypothetical protein